MCSSVYMLENDACACIAYYDALLNVLSMQVFRNLIEEDCCLNLSHTNSGNSKIFLYYASYTRCEYFTKLSLRPLYGNCTLQLGCLWLSFAFFTLPGLVHVRVISGSIGKSLLLPRYRSCSTRFFARPRM